LTIIPTHAKLRIEKSTAPNEYARLFHALCKMRVEIILAKLITVALDPIHASNHFIIHLRKKIRFSAINHTDIRYTHALEAIW
jgi:hypothetical protein